MSASDTNPPARPRVVNQRRVLTVAASGWVALLGYFLLVPDPPDLWYNDIASVDGPGHFLAGIVTGAIVFLVVEGRVGPRWHSALLATVIALLVLLGLEITQALGPARGFEGSDAVFSVLGIPIGVAGGWVARWAVRGPVHS